METTRTRRPLWWAVLAGGVLLVVTALVLALTSRAPDDFGDVALEREPAGQQPAQPAEGGAEAPDPAAAPAPAGDAARSTAAPERASRDRSQVVPVVPAEARRPAQASAEQAVAPVGLRIPTLDVAVDVVPVGVDDEGLMEIPESGQDVGWYRFGPAPGAERGSAVLASHVNTREEGQGVLAGLGELRPGDTVTVTLEDGSTVDYAVTDRRTVPKAELDERALFDRTGPARLALVTCGGPWQEERSSYRDNVIVLAEPVTASS